MKSGRYRLRQYFSANGNTQVAQADEIQEVNGSPAVVKSLDIPPDDPLLPLLLSTTGVLEVSKLQLQSPTLELLKKSGISIAVPLVSQGELIGLLNLGPRLSEQDYSSDDLQLLSSLGSQASPALRVSQLARLQQSEAQEKERIDQELKLARVIQQSFLPRQIPQIPGWELAAYWQPARLVGGDFYDFIDFEDGRLGVVIADVTDKGVPAAMVMATTRSILRAAAEGLEYPGMVLSKVNNQIVDEIPEKMFITCLYAILDPRNGQLIYANAGHDLPYHRSKQGVAELYATGMPLGLMKNMFYEEHNITLEPDDSLLLYSDGLVEAHDPQGQMFGFPRLQRMLSLHRCDKSVIQYLLDGLSKFTGEGWEQEDDVTFVTLRRVSAVETPPNLILEFELSSKPGNEREAISRVEAAVKPLDLPQSKIERLKTAVGEACMNAMEHGNRYQEDVPVIIQVLETNDEVRVRVKDQGGGRVIPEHTHPDLEAKLGGLQTPRGWGLFLIENMVDHVNIETDPESHTLELVIEKGETD